MTNLEAALGYAENGWNVFPLHNILPTGACSCGTRCADPGKHPRVPWKENATTDVKQVNAWWNRWPEANIGVATGPESGLWVLDLDNKKSVDVGDGLLIGEGTHSLRVLEDMYGPLPETLAQITGSGGTHLIFRYPADAGRSFGNRVGIVPSVDVRGAGGYIVAAPSNHVSGNLYQWVDPFAFIAEAPSWIINLASTERRATDLSPGETVMEGGRNDYLYRLGAKLRGEKSLGYMELLGALLIHNREECQPPLEEDEVVRIAQNVDRLPANEPEPVIMLPTRGARYEPNEEELNPGDDLALSIHDLLSRDIPAPPALVHGLIDGGTGVLLAGPPNVGKSWFAFELALAVSTGTPFLGYQTEQAPVLVIDEEGTEWGDQSRFRMMVEGREIADTAPIPLHLAIGKRFKLDTPRGIDAVRRMCERYRPKLIIIDSLVRVTSGDENKSRDMEKFFAIAKMIMKNTGAAVVFIHHVRKQGKDDNFDLGDLIRGSSEIRAFFDTILIAQENKEADGVELHVNKQRWRKKQPSAIYQIDVVEDESARITFLAEIEETITKRDVTSTRNYILRRVAELCDAGGVATAEAVAAAVGRSVTSVRSHLNVLAQEGQPLESYSVVVDRGRPVLAYRLRQRKPEQASLGLEEE